LIPREHYSWLQTIVQDTLLIRRRSERILFVNAWNEWAEGHHLEPDRHWGAGDFEATRRTVRSAVAARS